MRRKRCEERGDEGEKGKVGRKRWEKEMGRKRWGERGGEKEVARKRWRGRERWGERGGEKEVGIANQKPKQEIVWMPIKIFFLLYSRIQICHYKHE